MKDIELHDPVVTVGVMRELAGIRVYVPSNRNYPIERMDQLRVRVREMAQAIVDGGTMERSPGSLAASDRKRV